MIRVLFPITFSTIFAACGENSDYCGNTDRIPAHAGMLKSTKMHMRNGAAMGWFEFIPAVKMRARSRPPQRALA
jgi:hypothetical protein